MTMFHQRILRNKNLRKRIKKTMFCLNKELAVRIIYRIFNHAKLNLENPVYLNEKLQWLKLYYYDEVMVQCADKYRVREFIESRGYGHILNELYGVYEKAEDIDFDKLPDKFVLKANHGCGMNIIVDDKSELDLEKTRAQLNKWLKEDYYWNNAEWVYQGIKPKIICEKNLNTAAGEAPTDYKVFCFDGKPRVICIIKDRNGDIINNIYDLEWNLIDAWVHYPNNKVRKVEKPELLEEIIRMCSDLSAGFPQVRVDFYIHEGKIVFGELTFFNGSGLIKIQPEWFDRQMGDWIELPERKDHV